MTDAAVDFAIAALTSAKVALVVSPDGAESAYSANSYVFDPEVGHGPDHRGVPELFVIWIAPVGTPPCGIDTVAGPIPASNHSD